ncbi:transglycosylase domain-containing protein [Catenuloplanes japonicus]|uniref:transglycosylase domain-containing protein n=1 Tax=Catenuloplanes japonicus TaxID=33876 RepID=UPI00069052B1|nr:transglycosylase domain-containing protein [Catenuloplanes japonicus]
MPGTPGSASPGRATVGGSAAVGGARVPAAGAPGRASVGSAGPGRASVGASAAVGGARVPGAGVPGRASVRPVSPAGPGYGGPGGPGRRTRGSASLDPEAAKRAKRRKIANWSIAAFAVVIMTAGVSIVGLTYFFDDIPDINTFEPEASAVVYADGSEVTKLGEANRTVVSPDKISKVVKDAVVAAEDNKFYDHHGIDMKGIARAAWNNVSGGTTQGASTITQQYARHAADLTGINYNRKIREALLSRKIEDTYSKDEILSFYLNAIYFGRGANGIEAAAKAYFNKSVTTPPGEENAITPSEAAVLAAVIKQPEPVQGGHQGYDPAYNIEASKERWGYTLNNMVAMGTLSAEDRAKAEYPKAVDYDPEKTCHLQCVDDKPIGHVLKYVQAELKAMGITDWRQKPYKIKISINPTMQKLAQEAASRDSKSSPMNKLAENHQAALVAINPANGQVLAYYGGDNGLGFDYAGLNGGHPPGSTFKMYTLAAGLREGMSMDSYWDATKTEDEKRNREISDAGRAVPSCKQFCSLEFMTKESRNTAFYWMTDAMGPDKVVAAARDAGVKSMWTNEGDVVNLTEADPAKVAPSKFDVEVGFGQYPVKVIEHVNGLATLAARGVYNQAHFVVSVEKRNTSTGEWAKVNGEQLKPDQRFDTEQIDSMLKVLQKIPAFSEVNPHDLAGGRPAFAKSGTWELGRGNDPSANGDAWYMGATPQIAAGVWVGGKGDREALKESNGNNMFGGGTPGQIWENFMNAVNKELKMKVEKFPEGSFVGDPSVLANGVSPAPKPQDTGKNNPNPGKSCEPFDFDCLFGNNNGGGNNTPTTPTTPETPGGPPGQGNGRNDDD